MHAIHQFVAGFSNGDAISNEAIAIRDIFRTWGYESNIFSEAKRILPELRENARDVSEYIVECKPDDIVLLHLSIGSPVNDIFASLPCKKAILYHNITPSHYFNTINEESAYNLSKGNKQVKSLADTATVNMTDSKFNAEELKALGYKDCKILPLILNMDKLKLSYDKKILKEFDDETINILFVGRCAPNKKIEDILSSFFYFNKFVKHDSRFIHVGSFAGTERYYYYLRARAKELNINSKIHFVGAVTQPQLNAFYKCSDIFLCMSEHEGFCIPLLESMFHNLPVMAYASSAVPETMDGAGILFNSKRFDMIAEMMGQIVSNSVFRSAIIKKQQQRLARYCNRNLIKELRQYLKPLLSTHPS